MRRRLRVLHLLSNAFLPRASWQGSDPVARLNWPASSIVRHAHRGDFQVILGSLAAPEGEVGDLGVPVHVWPLPGRAHYPRAIAGLARWLRAESIDVVQAHLFDASVVGLAAARLAGRPVAVATGHHSHEFAVLPRNLSYAVDAFCHARLAEHLIVPSRFMRDTVAAAYGIPHDRIAVVHHGLDPDRLTSPAGARARVRAELGIEDRIVLGAIGRLSWIKQQTALVEAFAAVAAAEPRAVLVIVGTGDTRAQLEELVRARNLGGRVLLTGGRLDVPDVLAAIDLFVHPALTESFGLVLLEAMAAGKPLLSTAVGIAPELITDGDNGLLVPPGDREALTRGLQRLLAIRDRWTTMGEVAQLRSLPFRAPTMVAAYEDCYRRWVRTTAGR